MFRRMLFIILAAASIAHADYLGSWAIDDYVPIPASVHRFSTGLAYLPTTLTYSIYEDGNATGIDEDVDMTVGSPFDAKTGLYLARRQLTAVAGFEAGKNYSVRVYVAVDSVTANAWHTFQILADTANATVTTNLDTKISDANAVADRDTAAVLSYVTDSNAVLDRDVAAVLTLATDSNAVLDRDVAAVSTLVTDGNTATALDIAGNLTYITDSNTVIDATVELILADTDELQADWTNGGRLDLILDDTNSNISRGGVGRYASLDSFMRPGPWLKPKRFKEPF